MAKVGRNDPCPCGSQKKAKRCCFSSQRVADEALIRAAFDELCRSVARDLKGVDHDGLYDLFHDVVHLPELDLSLQVRLPALSPLVERARDALEEEDDGDDRDPFFDAVEQLARQIDSSKLRLELANAVVVLRDAGHIEPKVAAAAVFDLSTGATSAFLTSSIAESVGVSAGHHRMPAGLIISAA